MTQTRRLGARSGLGRLLLTLALLAAACGGTESPASALTTTTTENALQGSHRHARVCAAARPGEARCHAWVRVDDVTGQITPFVTPAGFGPADLTSAYKLPASGGTGVTIAIVDAMDDPNAESDLATYRSQFGLPACTTANGCFRKVNQNGAASPLPASDVGWGQEISLDLDMASAICPNCKILLVEASTASIANLGAAVNTAAALGANVISNSYGGGESAGDPSTTSSFYNHPGILITASSGDSGFGVEYPAAATTVLAVGGTHLVRDTSARGWTETAWSGAGSGCSAVETKPAWQHDTGCARRTVADVSAVADPNTGVAVFDSFGAAGQTGWLVFGGTSVAAPVVASVFARTGHANATPQYPYSNTTQFFDAVGGTNGTCSPSYLCTAVAGYDGPTGLGTPNGTAMAGTTPPPANDFSVSASPTSVSIVAGNSGTATISTATTAGSAQTVSLSTSATPAGVTASVSPASVTSGGSATLTISTTTAAAAGTFTLTVTGTAASGSHSTTVSVTISGAGGACASSTQLFASPGFESGATGWTASASVIDATTSGSAPRTGTTKAWLDGYGTTHTDTLFQNVTIPAGACSATLSFWLKITTAETTTTTAFDNLTVTVRNTAGTVLSTLGTFSNLNHGTTYVQRTFNVSSFKGQTVRIEFVGAEDASLQTSFFIDDAALTVVQ
ncbi:MAG TPA: S53 family peptidase [Myxococcales bacterium]|nr:S53 family peptidase [Myxococcales bacterium]